MINEILISGYFDDLNYLTSAIQAVIFASEGQISLERIFEIFNAKNTGKSAPSYAKKRRELILKAIDAIKSEFNDSEKHGIYLSINNDNFSFKTRPEHNEIISELLRLKPQKFTRPQLETLSIIAYRQPVIKSEIDGVRGVDSGAVIRFLLEKNLVKTAGRKDIVGRPLIYKTTDRFLKVFNLKGLDDLPSLKEVEGMLEKTGGFKDKDKEDESELPF